MPNNRIPGLPEPTPNKIIAPAKVEQNSPSREKTRPIAAVSAPVTDPSRDWIDVWENLVRLGLGETTLRIGTGVITLALILIVVWVMNTFYVHGPSKIPDPASLAVAGLNPTPTSTFHISAGSSRPPLGVQGISRLASLHTTQPTRPRFDLLTYKVQSGDTVFGIAEKFGLRPQTILWGNYATLADDPERLLPDQQLNILPIDGVLYQWHTGDGINSVAKYFSVNPDDIINWPGNHLNPQMVGDLAAPNIQDGTLLVVPGGQREFTSWTAPRVVRTDPQAAKNIGSGACSQAVDGPIGAGNFIWPTTEKFISGYGYSPETNHFAIDIGGHLGNAVFAADSGVVVYSGWSDLGYGNLIMIDHGNGWQSLYAHLSAVYVGCGVSIAQGGQIGAVGSTGNSSGPHLHFELHSDKYGKVNPLNFLPQ